MERVYSKELSPEDAKAEFSFRVYIATGNTDQQGGLRLLAQACDALARPSDTVDDSIRNLNIIAKAMQALEPSDEIEGQLVSQLIVLNEQCMAWLGRAMKTE